MKLRYAFIIVLLCFVSNSIAQDWQVADPYAFNDETVVYATLQSNVPTDPQTDFVLAAFIDGECRAEARTPVVGVDGSRFFILRVKGDQTSDKGKAIAFRTYHKPTRKTYDLTVSTPQAGISYSGESEGTPSRPIVLLVERDDDELVPLESLFFVADGLAAGLTTRVRLEPVPANASFDAYEVQLSFTGIIAGWTAMQQQRVDREPLCFDLTPEYPGIVQVQATVGGKPVTLRGDTGAPLSSLEVGAQVDLKAGWQWRSNPYGDITSTNIGTIFSEAQLVEARTQDALVYNDPEWGYFGTLMDTGIAQNTCYKVKMGSTPYPTVLRGGHYESAYSVLLDGEWTWVGVPYYYDRPVSEALNPSRQQLPEGMVIVSKEDGSAEFNGSRWTGDLTLLRRGQGVMVYSPLDVPFSLAFTPEADMPQAREQQESSRPASTRLAASAPWHYDASRFMNNTTIVAEVDGMKSLSDSWTIGVFVGNECRGEGHYVEGRFFITAHTERGEQLRLVLRHEPTGTTTDIVEKITAVQMRMGSLRQPVVLHATDSTMGIDERRMDDYTSVCYDLSGRKVSPGKRGIVLRRQADGKTYKTINDR